MEKSKRSLNTRMKHGDDLSHNVGVHYQRRQSKDTDTIGKKESEYENERSTMHDDPCIGINHAHAHVIPKCFKSLHILLGFALCLVSSIEFLSL